jgi:tight adherence protein B
MGESTEGLFIFLGMIFIAVFLLTQGMAVPVFGEGGKMRKRLKERLGEIEAQEDDAVSSLLRDKNLGKLSPLERQLEALAPMEHLSRVIQQSGHHILAYRLTLLALGLGLASMAIVWTLTNSVIYAPFGFFAGLLAPFMKVFSDRKKRVDAFEVQLPDAIDSMRRALRAGHPFSASLKLVAQDMDDPVAHEMELTFADINYGNGVRRAMLGLLQRMPSMTVMALVTAVLIQKETGGNLAEILDQISRVIRSRFKFYRRVKTLSAEGRMSAWILAMIPFVLFAAISVTSPDYLPRLIENPVGKQVIAAGAVMGVIGLIWIRRIIRVEV